MTRPTKFASLAGVTAIAAALWIASPAAAENFSYELPCGKTVPNKLASLGIAKAQIGETLTEEEWTHNSFADVFQGWTVWMQPKTCTGRLVVKLTSLCTVEAVYTTGDCTFKGVPNY